ncbi:hypothetical protein JCM19047_3206 [Bacillus sp. JCM 19047]|nr:hypothetical protein JCM19047_3206 [Bacillus sp. JCM 19047]
MAKKSNLCAKTTFKIMKQLLTKYMFNISGLGFWPFSVKDSVTLVKRSKTTKVLNEMEQYQYDVEDDYPWKHQMR